MPTIRTPSIPRVWLMVTTCSPSSAGQYDASTQAESWSTWVTPFAEATLP